MSFFSDATTQALKKQKRSPSKSPSSSSPKQEKQEFGDATIIIVHVAGKQQARLLVKLCEADRKGFFFKQQYEWVDRFNKNMPVASAATDACVADGTLLNSFPYASGFYAGSAGEVNIPVNSVDYAKLLLEWLRGRDEIKFSSWSGEIVIADEVQSVLDEWDKDEVEVYAIKDKDINVVKLKNETEELALHEQYDGVCKYL